MYRGKVYRGYYTKISSLLKLSEKYSLVERSTYGDLVIFFIQSPFLLQVRHTSIYSLLC